MREGRIKVKTDRAREQLESRVTRRPASLWSPVPSHRFPHFALQSLFCQGRLCSWRTRDPDEASVRQDKDKDAAPLSVPERCQLQETS
jgi:hypothetical protein